MKRLKIKKIKNENENCWFYLFFFFAKTWALFILNLFVAYKKRPPPPILFTPLFYLAKKISPSDFPKKKKNNNFGYTSLFPLSLVVSYACWSGCERSFYVKFIKQSDLNKF